MRSDDEAEQPAAPLVVADDRQAVRTIGGYLHQIWRSLLAWLSLEPNETLYLEGAEDFDILHANTGRTIQVKDVARNVTLASEDVLEAIIHFWEHRARNPGRSTQFHLLTTADRGTERDAPFGTDRGLDFWDRCREAGTDLGPLRQFLTTRRFPVGGRDGVREERSAIEEDLRAFIQNAPDDELREQLVRPIHWNTGSDPQIEIERQVEDASILHGTQFHRLTPFDSRQAVPHLLRHVSEVIVRPAVADRRLTYVDLLREFERVTKVMVSNAQVALLVASGEGPATAVVPVAADSPAPLPGDADASWKARLDEARAIQMSGQVRTALQLLQRYLAEALAPGSTASAKTRARILNNIAAAHLDLAQPTVAVESFQQALDYQPDDPTLLAHLAQAELLAEAPDDALRHASQALAGEPRSRAAWSVRIQASPDPIPEDEIPPEVRTHPEILAARAMVLARADDPAAVVLLKDALRTGPRTPQLLITLAERIYSSLFPRPATDAVPADEAREIARLAAEAAAALDGTEQTRWHSRACLVQGAAADLLGDRETARALFDRAMAIDPTSARARHAAARSQMAEGNGAAALYLLDGIPEAKRRSEWYALRALSLLAADRPGEVEDAIRRALATLDPATAPTVLPQLADTVLRSGRLALMDPVLGHLDAAGPRELLHLFRARVGVREGDTETADREYAVALEEATPALRADVHVEYATYLQDQGRHDHAVQLFEDSGAMLRDERIAGRFARSLLALRRWERISALLEALRARGELPAWGMDLEARLAMRRDDVPALLAALERLVRAHPEDVDARLRLAHTLLRAGRQAEAAEVLAPLERADGLDAYEMTNLALMLVDVDRPGRAVELAYEVLRQYPDDPDLQSACIRDVFLRAAPQAPADLFTAPRVGPDTWVRLKAGDGEEVAYVILSGEPHDVRRNELLVDDPRARPFLGLRIGDVVTLRAGAANEKEFRVAELKTALLHAFHDAMIAFQVRFPDRTDLQMVHVGEGEDFDPSPVYQMIHRAGATGREVLDLYRQKRLPLGALATDGRSLRRTYLQLLFQEDMPVYVEEPDPEQLAAAMADARKETVVLTATGLATLKVLGRLELLRGMYRRLIVPHSLVDDLNHEAAYWDQAQQHGFTAAREKPDHTFSFTEFTPADLEAPRRELVELRAFVLEHAEVSPRPIGPRNEEHENARDLVGASSCDALALAGADVGLHADDWGLRHLSRLMGPVVGFSTYAMLRVAHERGQLSAEEMYGDITTLVELGHTFIPIDGDLLYHAVARAGFQFDVPVLRLLDRLAGPEATVESATAVAVAFLRSLALSPLGSGALGAATMIAVERLTTGRDLHDTVLRVRRQAAGAFHLLPRALATVRDRLDAFVAARRLAP